jgi:hypothetical protein
MMLPQGYKFSEEVKRKISEKSKLKWADPEYRRKILSTSLFKRGDENIARRSDVRQKISAALKGKNRGKIPWNKGLTKEVDARIKVTKGFKGRHHSEETKRKISESVKKTYMSEEMRKRISEGMSEEGRKRLSELLKKRLKKDEFVRRVFQAMHIRPTKLEKRIMEFLEQILPNEYVYVGDGSFILGGRCPDFLNKNGKKKVIEVFGDYWHRNDNPEERKAIFRKYGFDCLVIWEHELNNMDSLKQKVLEFNNKAGSNSVVCRLDCFRFSYEEDA